MIFDYCLRDKTKQWVGTCRGATDAQAMDRARVDYIYTRWDVTPTDKDFRQRKADADEFPVKVVLSVGSLNYYQDLKQRMREGDQLSNTEMYDYKEFQQYFKRK